MTILLIACTAVALLLAALYLGQRRLIYFPAMTQADADIPATLVLERPGGIQLRGWADRPGEPRALIYFGGNAESLQHVRGQLAACCPDWSAYFLPYRGYAGSDGEPAQAVILPDALALYDEVSARHPGQPIAVIGRSLGSDVAAWVASQRPVTRLVLITPFDSLGEVAKVHYPWLPVKWLLREHYDSAGWLQGRAEPTLVLRATDDHLVPAGNTDALVAALSPGTRVITLEGSHDGLSSQPAYTQALADFLR